MIHVTLTHQHQRRRSRPSSADRGRQGALFLCTPPRRPVYLPACLPSAAAACCVQKIHPTQRYPEPRLVMSVMGIHRRCQDPIASSPCSSISPARSILMRKHAGIRRKRTPLRLPVMFRMTRWSLGRLRGDENAALKHVHGVEERTPNGMEGSIQTKGVGSSRRKERSEEGARGSYWSYSWV